MEFQRAIEFVVRCHAGQTRKGVRNGVALPYVTHCFDVLKTVWLCGACDDVTGPAALGHDLIEDCPELDQSLLRENVGDRAAAVVRELTFLYDRQDSRSPAEQKAAYMSSFRTKSIEALAIKACDRYVNVRDFLHDRPEYAAEYLARGEAVFDAVDFRRVEMDSRFEAGVADRLLKLRWELLRQLKT